MSKHTRYNQMLFLMTLSVYMGLVLAGGASPALAQSLSKAALAKGFELSTELEAKDDLDKKPDDELNNLAKDYENFLEEVENFIDDLKKLHQIKKFDSSYNEFQTGYKRFSSCGTAGCGVSGTIETAYDNDRWLEPALVDFKSGLAEFASLGDCLKNVEPTILYENATRSEAKVTYDKALLSISVSFVKASPEAAKQLTDNFLKARELFVVDSDDDNHVVLKVLHQNTKISFENNQILIITNLPRAGLDKLLAAK